MPTGLVDRFTKFRSLNPELYREKSGNLFSNKNYFQNKNTANYIVYPGFNGLNIGNFVENFNFFCRVKNFNKKLKICLSSDYRRFVR